MKFANVDLRSEASQPLSTCKLVYVIILGLCKMKEPQDQRGPKIKGAQKYHTPVLLVLLHARSPCLKRLFCTHA